MLIIAHRMRTVDGVDKIVVLKDGRVAEMGTPAELKKGRRDLQAHGGYAAQFRAVEIPVTEAEYE